MCIVVDANLFTVIFNPQNSKHEKYSAITKWIFFGKGYLVVGGGTYKKEIHEKIKKYRRVLLELAKVHKMYDLKTAGLDTKVDSFEEKLKRRLAGSPCNDCHIVSLLNVSKCKLFCSEDDKSFSFISDRDLYDDQLPPKIVNKKTKPKAINEVLRSPDVEDASGYGIKVLTKSERLFFKSCFN